MTMNTRIKIVVAAIFLAFNGVTPAMCGEKLNLTDGDTFVFKVKNQQGDVFESTTEYRVDSMPEGLQYGYTNSDKFEKWEVNVNQDAVPSTIVYTSKGNTMELNFDGKGSVQMTGLFAGKQINVTGFFSPSVSLENALILRTRQLKEGEQYVFDLLQTSEFPALKAYEMYFKVAGSQTITVQAGTFQCKKVLFSLKGWRGLFYKAYYYVSDDKHRYLVKMENIPMGGWSELIRIENRKPAQTQKSTGDK